MPKKVQKAFCTMYRRSDTEKRTWEALKAVEAQKKEIEELKKQIAELKGNSEEVPEEEVINKRKSKKMN